MRYSLYNDFSSLPPGYGRLFDEWRSRSYCYSLDWFYNFVATVKDPEHHIAIYGVESENRAATPLAAVPMQYSILSGGPLGLRTLRPLANYYASLFGPVLDLESQDVEALVGHLVRAMVSDKRRWDAIDLSPLDTGSPVFPALQKALGEAGMVSQTYFCFANWYLEVGGRSYAEYLKSLPSFLSKKIPYKTRRLEKHFNARIQIITSNDGLDEALRGYETVYRSSWKVPEPYPNFLPGLARTAIKNGWLRLGIVYLNDEPAAAQLWLVNDGVASIFKLSYDERFVKDSVGTILTAKLMEHVMNIDKVHTVDFLSGDDDYKKHWMSHRRERWGIYAMNRRTIPGCLSIVRHVGGRAAKQLWERVRGASAPPPDSAQTDNVDRDSP